MSLALVGRNASYEFRWLRWVLLRDTVASRFEDGVMGSRFPRFASIGDALVCGVVRLPADQLATEIKTIQTSLAGVPIDALVLGPATAATLYPGAKLEEPRPLNTRELAQIAPIGSAKDLQEYFSSMCESIADVCANPADNGMVEVLDG